MATNGKRVCVIGAGTAGLCALKNSLQQGMDAIAYEQCSEIGGTWVYTKPGENDVHSSMYEGLRTNLPKEVMGYPDYSYPSEIEQSFVPSAEVLKFLQSYAQHFDLSKYIKLQHEIIRVRPLDEKWEIYIRDIKNDTFIKEIFDFVFVCNGHYSMPLMPDIEGIDSYKGQKLHSHWYRKPDTFEGTTVLVIGAGPSGMDITNHISKFAKQIYLSHNLDPAPCTDFMPNVTQKTVVKRFTADGAVFKDDTTETFDHIIFCTGYKYTFPFLSIDVSLRVDDNFVHPLYKHCINIHYPTMALIGLPFYVCPSQSFDLQVRFALAFFTKKREFPSREEMFADLEKDKENRRKKGLTNRLAHAMGDKQYDYYQDLSETAGIENIKPVINKIMEDCSRKYIYELATYRNDRFKVLDDETFVKFPLETA
ncbi:uncharacterized protein LOC105230162 [Bactrocera dorsalis]|uniref:Flavin-containing monooxygenase n=1 Tax=Bactrocera dorsalis TaxID=27457 RepID=A0A034VYP1_BACDO|nr:uncharacterized protein LOC105230162 [Bactrocera dorsalis]